MGPVAEGLGVSPVAEGLGVSPVAEGLGVGPVACCLVSQESSFFWA